MEGSELPASPEDVAIASHHQWDQDSVYDVTAVMETPFGKMAYRNIDPEGQCKRPLLGHPLWRGEHRQFLVIAPRPDISIVH